MEALDNKYTKLYYRLMESRRARAVNDLYTERHHIKPKSLGGTNQKQNLINLTPREHYIAHLLLTKMFRPPESYKMYKAFHFMCVESGTHHSNRYRPPARMYEKARSLVGVAVSASNKGKVPWNKGVPRTDEVKKAVSNANSGKRPWNKGIPRTDEVKKKLSLSRKGRSPSNKGIPAERIHCPFCQTHIAGVGNYKRWHGDRCRSKHA